MEMVTRGFAKERLRLAWEGGDGGKKKLIRLVTAAKAGGNFLFGFCAKIQRNDLVWLYCIPLLIVL